MIISQMLSACFLGVILSGIALVCGVMSLNKRDRETERYIARLETENRRLKETVTLTETKANRYRLMIENK